jgi:REP element-mobilizing transposase RayT
VSVTLEEKKLLSPLDCRQQIEQPADSPFTMGHPLRYESSQYWYLITSRTAGSRLWFVNNPKLWERIQAFLARYQEIYEVEIFAFIIMGNHIHLIARFPKKNKAAFMRDFNAIIPKLVKRFVPHFRDGRLWGRRYSEQALPREEDLRHWFYYCALNPVSSGLTRVAKDYPCYNSFWDASAGRERTFKIFLRSEFLEARYAGRAVTAADFVKKHTLKYSKLPGIGGGPEAYMQSLRADFNERQRVAVEARLQDHLGFAPIEKIRGTLPGSYPFQTKTSSRYDLRPLVLSLCVDAKKEFLQDYFEIVSRFRLAATAYRQGDWNVTFPPGTYRPGIYLSS